MLARFFLALALAIAAAPATPPRAFAAGDHDAGAAAADDTHHDDDHDAGEGVKAADGHAGHAGHGDVHGDHHDHGGHADEHSDDHVDEHADEHADEHVDEHADEHPDEHADDHADDHADKHADEHAGHGSHGDEHGDHHDEPTGPHGGRLLESGDFAVEVSIFELGVAPQLRVYFYDDGNPLDPSKATLRLVLHRLAAPPEPFTFKPVGDFLLGDHAVAEPHSFEVEIAASWGPHSLASRYESFEARVRLPEAVANASGVGEVVAGERDLGRTRRLTGRIGIPTDRLVHLTPRFAGVVRQAGGRIGGRVHAGENLAVVENSATLATYRIDAPIDGTILARSAVAGGSVTTDDVLYTIADLREVWADFDVYRDDVAIVHPGERVIVRDDSGRGEAAAAISYVSPLRDVHTQTMLARAVLGNDDGRWAPGSFVTGTIAIDEEPARIAVPVSALQTWHGYEVVFLHAQKVWEPRPVRVGRRGDEWVEVLEGIQPGNLVATGNTFLLRAEIEKAGAAHDH